MGCPNSKIILDLVSDTTNQRFTVPARCKSWSCPYCSVINSRNLGSYLAEALASYLSERRLSEPKMRYTVKLVTLTVPGREFRALHTVQEAELMVKSALKGLLESLRRHYDLSEYFWVREYQQGGWAHIHLLILGAGISGKGVMRFINDFWECRGLGRAETALVRKINGVSRYLCKYLSKPSSKQCDIKGLRAFGISKKLSERVKASGRVSDSDYTVVAIYRNEGGVPGEKLWAIGDASDWRKVFEESVLHALSQWFYEVSGLGGHKQLKFDWGCLWGD